jgi:DNA-binding MarR family transcriptional regulator/GNAT superfamily N-acetyltransferase
MLIMKIEIHNRLRSFGRSYTKRFGLLNRNPYHKSLSLLESRIVFEIQNSTLVTARGLLDVLQIDKGYLSRSVSQLIRRKLVKSQINPKDGRQKFLRLTSKGRALFKQIDIASSKRSEDLLRSLNPAAQRELAASLAMAEILMGEKPLRNDEICLRSPQSGDFGWVIGRHGEIYYEEFGWDMDFERLVGEIAIAFATKNDSKNERAWIAEARGVRLGCVFLVRETDDVAKLRILLVDPVARGLGLGRLLVRECIKFAGRAKYKRMVLWTNSVLHSARKIYEGEGFQLLNEESHHSFGKDLIGQYWELELSRGKL